MSFEISQNLITIVIGLGLIVLLANMGVTVLYMFFPNHYEPQKRGAGFWFFSFLVNLVIVAGYWLAWRL